MKLGVNIGYASPGTNPTELIDLAVEAEQLGYDSAWAAEAWGTDVVTVLSWLGAKTQTMKLGAGIMQIPARSAGMTAMTAATLDLMSGGRFLLGLGLSGPQVAEGWHGQPWGPPLPRTREYVELVRQMLRRDVVDFHGDVYDVPLTGDGTTGLGIPLKMMMRPLRPEIPIYLAAIGPKNVALAAEIADGWLPIFVSPERFRDVFPVESAKEGFDVAAGVHVVLTKDRGGGREYVKHHLALYVGGMGARGKNFYNDLVCRYGYEAEAAHIQDLYLGGKKREAAAAVPDALVDEVALVGSREQIADRLGAWRECGVTTLIVQSRDLETVRAMAELVLTDQSPLLIIENVEAFLDQHGLGSGPMRASRIGQGGGSNFSFLLERDDGRFVLRRPPRPPLPPSAHDMVREARLQLALAPHGIRLPVIRAVCEDESVIGVPFYVMDYLEGHVVTDELPAGLETGAARRQLGLDFVDALVEIHAADVSAPAIAEFVRPGSYLERQVRRFTQLWEINQTRELPDVEAIGGWLAGKLPEPLPLAVVHGDYRLGNAMVAPDDPTRILAVLDWEMGAVGDPRADVGYLLATYSEPGGEVNPLGASPVTASEGFPTKRELVEHYRQRSGRDVEPLGWFQALALWKAAVFCEAIYGRYVRGELAAEDANAARFELGVPLLAQTALEFAEAD